MESLFRSHTTSGNTDSTILPLLTTLWSKGLYSEIYSCLVQHRSDTAVNQKNETSDICTEAQLNQVTSVDRTASSLAKWVIL